MVTTVPAEPSTPQTVDPLRNGQTYLNQIRWSPAPENERSPLVAVLDTGVDAASPDLVDAVSSGARSFAPGAGPAGTDAATHGTQVAGIIAATPDNGVGITGISRSPVLAVKIAGHDGRAETSALVRGIRYAVARKARILNISFEGGSRSAVEQDAIDYAIRRGLIVVVASGNAGTRRLEYPGAYRQVISVAAVDETNARLDSSTRGPQVTLAAPGGNVLSTLPGGHYGQASGTSFAAAVVSGVAARVWAARPDLKASQVVEILERTARDVGPRGWDDQTGAGVVDLAAALKATPAPSDSAEPNDEPRKALRTATGLARSRSSATINGRVSRWRDPSDGYRVVLDAGDVFTAQLDGPAGTDMDLRLWRPNTPTLRRSKAFARTWQAAGSFGPASQESLQFTVSTSGVYTIEVDGGGDAGAYRLTLNRSRG